MSAENPEARYARLSWRCRRGMRELDLLLERFLSTGLESLGDGDVERLETLLAQPDQDILAWLSDALEPDDPDLCRIVQLVRDRIEFDAASKP